MRLRRSVAADTAQDLGSIVADDEVDPGRLVRALARAVVHVPLPGAAAEAQPRRVSDPAGPPLYVVEDDSGRHAFVYSTARRLVEAWGGGTTAAAVPMATLLAAWPDGTDLVVDAGLPHAHQVGIEVLRQAMLDAGGVPTPLGLRPSSAGWVVVAPDPEPVQIIGATRTVATGQPGLVGLWRAAVRDREPAARPTLTIVAGFATGTPADDVRQVMQALAAAIGDVDPQPVRLLARVPDRPGPNDDLAAAVTGADDPYWVSG